MINWKTSLVGLIGTLAMAAANYAGPHTWQGYVASLAPVAIGFLAKDFNVTGIGAAANTTPPTPAQVAEVKAAQVDAATPAK
jgi:hypothetical protein